MTILTKKQSDMCCSNCAYYKGNGKGCNHPKAHPSNQYTYARASRDEDYCALFEPNSVNNSLYLDPLRQERRHHG